MFLHDHDHTQHALAAGSRSGCLHGLAERSDLQNLLVQDDDHHKRAHDQAFYCLVAEEAGLEAGGGRQEAGVPPDCVRISD